MEIEIGIVKQIMLYTGYSWTSFLILIVIIIIFLPVGGIYDVMIIVVGNEHSNQSSNPKQDCLHFILG